MLCACNPMSSFHPYPCYKAPSWKFGPDERVHLAHTRGSSKETAAAQFFGFLSEQFLLLFFIS